MNPKYILREIEKAVLITRFEDIRHYRKGGYERIYWGAEFCQNLLPSVCATEKLLGFTRQHRLRFTLVTPFVTETGLIKIRFLLDMLSKQDPHCEVVVNDWGVLHMIRTVYRGYFAVVLGRLLLRQFRDPAVSRVLEKQPPFVNRKDNGRITVIVHRPPGKRYREGIQRSFADSASARRFLSRYGIQRVELNNPVQGVFLKNPAFKKSIYTPYVNISTTRFCPMDTGFQRIYRIDVCHKECRRYFEILKNTYIPFSIYKIGNTTFYKNRVDLTKIKEAGVDRIVFQAGLPG